MSFRSKQRIRRTLTLAQRVDVIRRYEKKTSLRRLAGLFKCGRTQIKGILRNRNHTLELWTKAQEEALAPTQELIAKPEPDVDSILSSQASHSQDVTHKDPKPPERQNAQICLQSTDIVEIVLIEWVKRARSYHINISDEILNSFAREIADFVDCQDSLVSNEWLRSFKQKYNITEHDVRTENVSETKVRKPLSISVIIEDLRRERGIAIASKQVGPEFHFRQEVSSLQSLRNETPSRHQEAKTNPSYEQDDSAINMDADELTRNGFESGPASVAGQINKEIRSYREALNHLGPLEQFALIKENIRAVGLINQLENLFWDEVEKSELNMP